MATPFSISSSVMVSGGSRRTLSFAVSTNSPCSSAAFATSMAFLSLRAMPTIRPRPLTPATPSSFASFSRSSFALRCTSSKKPGAVTVFSTARPPAQQTGLPPNVEPCEPLSSTSAHFSLARHAPMGRPPAIPFASVVTSALCPNCSPARNVPVLPTPVCTSSAMTRMSLTAHFSNTASTNACSSAFTPPSPWIYSSITAQTVSSSFASRSAMSLATT